MKNFRGKAALSVCFAVYSAGMLWLLLVRSRHSASLSYPEQLALYLNLRPFQTVCRYLRLLATHPGPYLRRHALANLAGNVVLFIPLGFFLPAVLSKLRAFWRTLLCTLLGIAAIEVLQLVLKVGCCDIDDLLLNTLGASAGYLLFYLLRRIKRKKES